MDNSEISNSKELNLKLSHEVEKGTLSKTNKILHKEVNIDVSLPSGKQELLVDYVGDNYTDLNKRLLNLTLPKIENVTNMRAEDLENPAAYLRIKNDNIEESGNSVQDQLVDIVSENKPQVDIKTTDEIIQEDVIPSAPVLEEDVQVLNFFCSVQITIYVLLHCLLTYFLQLYGSWPVLFNDKKIYLIIICFIYQLCLVLCTCYNFVYFITNILFYIH